MIRSVLWFVIVFTHELANMFGIYWFLKTWISPKHVGLILLIPTQVVGILIWKENPSFHVLVNLGLTTICGFALLHTNVDPHPDLREEHLHLRSLICQPSGVGLSLIHLWVMVNAVWATMDLVLFAHLMFAWEAATVFSLTLMAIQTSGGKKNRLLEKIKNLGKRLHFSPNPI